MAGDEVAVTEFAGVFGPKLFGFYIKRTRGRVADAEEIANTCLHNVISAVRNGKYTRVPEASFEAFLFTIARNILSDWWEDQRPSFNERPFDETEVEPEPLMPNMEIVAAIDDAMMFLAGPDEEIISLRHFQEYELSFKEIGDLLGIKEGNARVRYFRAINKLRSMLEVDARIQIVLMRNLEKSAKIYEQKESE